jgi:hypothetical protein
MGTNFYWYPPGHHKCPTCGQDCESVPPQHIGKSSVGWTFLFQATKEIRSAKQWAEKLKTGKILDEYGSRWFPVEFWEMVSKKKDAPNKHSEMYPELGNFLDSDGNSFSEREFS